MLSTDEFAQWSKKVVLFLHNTSRCDDEPYPDLLFEKGGNGFPTVSYLAADGRLLQQVGHVTPVEELETAYQGLQDWQRLKAAVAAGARDKAKQLFLMEVDNGYVTFAEAQASLAGIALDDAERAKVDQQLVNLEFRDILRSTKRSEMAAGGERFHRMLKANRVPTSSQVTSFWQYMFAWAQAKKDADLFASILDECRERMGDDDRFARYIGMLERQLEELRK